MFFETIAITIAMYCLIQFYVQIKDDIRQHKPLLKITAIKLVIFLSFWQTIGISLLTSTGAIKANDRVQTPDIKVGIPALLLCIEMAFFAIFHIWSFSWKPYIIGSKEYMAEVVPGEEGRLSSYQGGFLGLKAIFDSFNAWDMLKATGRAAKWLFKGRKTRHDDSSYDLSRKNTQEPDFGAEGQKLSNFNRPTAYAPVSRPPHYSGLDVEEGDNLLANSQGMPMSRPPLAQMGHNGEPSFYEANEANASDIGLASSSYDDKYPSSYNYPPPSHENYRPYVGSRGGQGQESGVVTAPYPLSQSDGHNRLSMPYLPPSRSPDPPTRQGDGEGKEGMGNFL